jgi:hypothetical protein
VADNHFPFLDRSQERRPDRDSGSEIQYLLKAEEHLLRSISARVPLPEMLYQICNALNLEMGNMVSLIFLANDDAAGRAAIAKSAARLGLCKFCSAGVVADNAEVLGSLEMFCCLPRRLLLREVRLIERATSLAAVAIRRHNESSVTSTARSTSET